MPLNWDKRLSKNRICQNPKCNNILIKSQRKYCSFSCSGKSSSTHFKKGFIPPNKGKCLINKERLVELTKNKLSDREVSKILNVGRATVSKYRKEQNIKSQYVPEKDYGITREELYDLYVNQEMSQTDIAKLKQIARGAVRKLLIKYNIPRKPASEVAKIKQLKYPKKSRIKMSANEMWRLYKEELMHPKEIAKKAGCTETCIYQKIRELGKKIVRNEMAKARRLKFGPTEARHYNDKGYIYCFFPEHPNAMKGGVLAEHVYVMAEKLRRPLKKGEFPHHKNGIHDDNKPENLELWHKGHPSGQRVSDKLIWAREFIDDYMPKWLNKKAFSNEIIPF